ncbi:MAG: pyridoxal phosphate-dependent decarboxylase family protein [Gemmatimonadaceae bacterium]|jgi:aromatic-L-amino-acid decarboxylase
MTTSASDTELAEREERLARLRQLERASAPLDPGGNRRKKLRALVFAAAERFLRGIEHQRAFVESDSKGSGLLDFQISENAVDPRTALSVLEREVVGPGGHPASPGYLAYIPGGGLYQSALGDYLAAVSDKYAGVFFAGPGAVRMENMLIRWVADLAGYPATAAGNIASGGSIANLIAITTARDAHGLKSGDYARAVVYLSAQAHHSIQKALRIAGLADAQIRYVSLDERYRMRTDELEQAIRADRAAGLKPWLVAAAAGATDTGAVDPLDDIATIAQREECWFHVDAAYGGFFLLTDHGRQMMRGIERSDSAILDPHKGLFIPWGSGIVIVRDAKLLEASNSYSGNYMQDAVRESGVLSPADVSPELTKHFRGLRMWLPLILVGLKPFRAALEEKLLLARYFYDEIQQLGFETGPSPDLSIVTFRWNPPGADPERVNDINREIVDALRSDGRIFLSSTMLDGKFVIRLAVLGFRTHRRSIDLALRLLKEQASTIN